ncbi:coiled-coil domain-containing protein 170 [Gastrophryne carolinensis]
MLLRITWLHKSPMVAPESRGFCRSLMLSHVLEKAALRRRSRGGARALTGAPRLLLALIERLSKQNYKSQHALRAAACPMTERLSKQNYKSQHALRAAACPMTERLSKQNYKSQHAVLPVQWLSASFAAFSRLVTDIRSRLQRQIIDAASSWLLQSSSHVLGLCGASHSSGMKDKIMTYKNAAETAQSQQAALLVKNAGLLAEVSDLKESLAAKDVSVKELREELESCKEKNARQASHIRALKDTIRDLGHVTSQHAQADAHLSALRRDNKELKERISELENRVRLHLMEREKAEQRSVSSGAKLEECVARLSLCLGETLEEQEDPLGVLLTKVEGLSREHAAQKCKVTQLEDGLAKQQVEFRSTRDTIVKLVSEAEKHKRTIATFPAELQQLKQERDDAIVAWKSAARERDLLQEKLKDNHQEWGSLHQELLEKEKKIQDLQGALRTSDCECKAAHTMHQSFLSQLATILGLTTPHRSQEAVRQEIQEMCSRQQILTSTCEELGSQLDQQRDLYHQAMAKAYKAEELLQQHQDSVKHLHDKLTSEEMINDGFNMERKRLQKFLLQMAEKLNIGRDVSHEGVASLCELLLGRAEQLSRRDQDILSDNKKLICNLQKKVQSLREKLELRSSHNEQLEKRIRQLEREKDHRPSASADNSAAVTAQKLQKKVARLQTQLSDMKISHQDLAAQLTHMNALKEKVVEQKATIQLLSESLEKLEKIKDKAAEKVVTLKSELEQSEHESLGEKVRCQHMVGAVTNELLTSKRALEEVARREKQLVDFRETITRMMGYNRKSLAVPDQEIYDQLKRILRNNGPIDVSRTDRAKLPHGFRPGDGAAEYSVQHMNPRY